MSHADISDPEQIHTDDVQDIISKPPAWLLRWGITCFFASLILIGCLSALIRYPDVVKTKLSVSSVNPPNPVLTSIPGKLVKLLVNNGQYVVANQPLAYIESTASHKQVLQLLNNCRHFEEDIISPVPTRSISFPDPASLQLGALRSSYQKFYAIYLSYRALPDNRLTYKNNKQTITTALNGLIADIEAWKSKYVLAATYAGRVLFNGIVEENKLLEANQPVFYVASGNEQFFGEVYIPQYSMGKIKVGQEVLVKLQSYPYEEYGIVIGKLSYISEISVKDGAFIAKISFGTNKFSRLSKPVKLRYGMQADAEIITEETSVLKRILGNLLKILY